MVYGQFCPVAKASELLGERWTILIVRELLLGSTRYSELQRGLSRISPTLLTKRLKQLEQAGVVVRKRGVNQKGHSYFLTPSGKELGAVIESLAHWGMRWTKGQLSDDELDVEFLMWDIQRRVDLEQLPDGDTAICFSYEDVDGYDQWWLIVRGGEVDLCTENPGVEVDLYVNSSIRTMIQVWDGEVPMKQALRRNLITTQGSRTLARTMSRWLGINPFAEIRPVVAAR